MFRLAELFHAQALLSHPSKSTPLAAAFYRIRIFVNARKLSSGGQLAVAATSLIAEVTRLIADSKSNSPAQIGPHTRAGSINKT